jgi:hypothetical protein
MAKKMQKNTFFLGGEAGKQGLGRREGGETNTFMER